MPSRREKLKALLEVLREWMGSLTIEEIVSNHDAIEQCKLLQKRLLTELQGA